jgi:hypothetical protein
MLTEMDFESNTRSILFTNHSELDQASAPATPFFSSTAACCSGFNAMPVSSMLDNNNMSLSLKQQAMLNQFVSIAGCSFEQACLLLNSSNWQYQV